MAKKFYTVQKEIDGVTYTAQFNGVGAALRARDESFLDGSSNLGSEKFSEYILENVIVDPKGLVPDDFDSTEALGKVTAFGSEVMNGRFREKENKGAAKAKGE